MLMSFHPIQFGFLLIILLVSAAVLVKGLTILPKNKKLLVALNQNTRFKQVSTKANHHHLLKNIYVNSSYIPVT
jgi:hypothetical protein